MAIKSCRHLCLPHYLLHWVGLTMIYSHIYIFNDLSTAGYLSLYIPPESIPGRVAIGMTTILTLTAMFSGVRHTVPKVSYISFLDIWMVICLLYVCFFMFEFILVVYLKSIKKEEASKYVEKKCRVVFPLTFLIFNVLYWPGIHHL